MLQNRLSTVGRAERVQLPDLSDQLIPAKVDTGAHSSSIWVSQITKKADGLYGVLFGPGSEYYTGQVVKFANEYTVARITNSFGEHEMRYKIKLRVRLKGRLIRATFTLSDRSLQTYPILLGRRLLRGKFLVDVSQGEVEAERAKTTQLKREPKVLKDDERMSL